MVSQTQSGKGFEYALTYSLCQKLLNNQKIRLLNNNSYIIAKKSFEYFENKERDLFCQAAGVAIDHIFNLEPMLQNPLLENDELIISHQSSKSGTLGDPRDIVVMRPKYNWEIGFSVKNENNAVRHSRLSASIDFGKDWLGVNCSDNYMHTVKEIFYGLKKHANKKWNILSNKENDYYVPVLDAFTIEMKNIINYDPKIIYNLFEYLLGHHDFYKIMKYKESNTVIQAFNQNRSLNRSITTSMPKYRIKKLFFPKKLINIERINKNTVIITFEHGWQISFRIHNASSKIEPSLKFDIRFVGIPVQLHQHVAVW